MHKSECAWSALCFGYLEMRGQITGQCSSRQIGDAEERISFALAGSASENVELHKAARQRYRTCYNSLFYRRFSAVVI